MSDEAFHEIQLNGKQLVFLFMAGTVVAVVIFLCGVMVGRGVQPARAAAGTTATDLVVDPTAPEPVSATSTTGNLPLTAGEELTYAGRLESPTPPPETLRPPTAAAQPVPEPIAEPVPPAPEPETPAPPRSTPAPAATPPPAAAAATPAAATPAADAFAEPPGNGLVVQVMASRSRAEAEGVARRLSAKGYPVFITTNAGNYRVRVGKYATAREAEAIGARLEREEQFKPWITR